MIRERTFEVLTQMGMPASLSGLQYIADAMEWFDNGQKDGKLMALYEDVGKKHKTTWSSVERAMRHAFGIVTTKGNLSMVEKYLSVDNITNSNLLKLLYFRLKQEEEEKNNEVLPRTDNAISENIKYQYACQALEDDMILAIRKFVKNLKEVSIDACCKVG